MIMFYLLRILFGIFKAFLITALFPFVLIAALLRGRVE